MSPDDDHGDASGRHDGDDGAGPDPWGRPWLVAVGGSAGAMEPLTELLAGLPPTLPAAVLVVLHMHPRSGSMLPQILSRRSEWPVVPATDGERIVANRVYTAVPDRQLIVDSEGRLRVVRGPKESGHRPGIDPLFRSAAASSFRTIGVVLSGGLDDGSAGAAMILRSGGSVVVQDPAEAAMPDMPANALQAAPDAAPLPVRDIPAWIAATILDRDPIRAQPPSVEVAVGPELVDLPTTEGDGQFVCPDCGGTMQRVDDPDVLRFRCHVGHGWTAEALHDRQDDQLDAALWTALRTVEDQISLDERLLQRAEQQARPRGAVAIEERLSQRRRASQALWQLLTSGPARPDEATLADLAPPRDEAG
jgi:two-component system chemotaxis response regulator CheB